MPKVLSEADVAAFREKLCDIAEEQFAARGPDGVTMRQLAEAMGVSSMTPYRYFKDKDAILAAVRTRAFNAFAAAMEKAQVTLTKKGGGQPGVAYVDFALKNRAAYRMMFDTSQPTAADYPDLVKAMDRAKKTMTAGWKELVAGGALQGRCRTRRPSPLVGHAWRRDAGARRPAEEAAGRQDDRPHRHSRPGQGHGRRLPRQGIAPSGLCPASRFSPSPVRDD